jgi:hypothetical protein
MVHDLASGFADLFKSIAKSFPSSQATPSPTSWLDLDGFVDSLGAHPCYHVPFATCLTRLPVPDNTPALFDYALVGRQMESLYGALAHINADRIYTSMEKVLEYVDPIPDTASLSTSAKLSHYAYQVAMVNHYMYVLKPMPCHSVRLGLQGCRSAERRATCDACEGAISVCGRLVSEPDRAPPEWLNL